MDSLLFGYPISTYFWVIGLSSISGTVKYLNELATIRNGNVSHGKELLYFFRDVLSGIVSGLMAFWLCDSFSIKEPLNAVIVTIAGIMGNRAWVEFEALLKSIILRLPYTDDIRYSRKRTTTHDDKPRLKESVDQDSKKDEGL